MSGTVSEGEGSREKTGKAVCERKNKTGEKGSGCNVIQKNKDKRTCMWEVK